MFSLGVHEESKQEPEAVILDQESPATSSPHNLGHEGTKSGALKEFDWRRTRWWRRVGETVDKITDAAHTSAITWLLKENF